MLWPLASFGTAVERLFGYGLMIVGGGTCIWMPLSYLKPFQSRKAFGIVCCTVLLVTAAYKVVCDPQPRAAMANPAVLEVLPTSAGTSAAAAGPAVKGSVWPDPKTGSRSLASAQNAAPKPAKVLADRYTDNANGFSIRFPAGWTSQTFASGDQWYLDVTDGKSGLISVGFSPFPSSAGLDQLKPAGLRAHLQAQGETKLLGQGYGIVAGQKGLWFRYMGPIDTVNGRQVLQVVHYYVPLHDGRMLELRLAAAPARFAKVAQLLKKSASTLKLMPL